MKNRHIPIALKKPETKDGSRSMSLDHQYAGSVELIRRFNQFSDRLEALCGLPKNQELPRILEVSRTNALPSIWLRATLSPLEEKAILILSVLVFSSKRRWPALLQEFFRYEGWRIDLRGRPGLDFRDPELRPVARGLKIQEITDKLRPGYEICAQARQKRGYHSDDEQIAGKLKAVNLDEAQRNAILTAKSVEDAACRYFHETQTGVNVELKSIRNDWATFKRLRKRYPDLGH